MVEKLTKIGIVPGQDPDASKLELLIAEGLTAAVKLAQDKITSWLKKSVVAGDSKHENGWLYFKRVRTCGTNYRQRAMITYYGFEANIPEDAIYPLSERPDVLNKYSGAHTYVIHFPKGQMPPDQGFWSLTIYDTDFFLVPNALNRYTLSERNKFKSNASGSVDRYIQHDSPGKEGNWLPAPAGSFVLKMRLYWPNDKPPSLLDGSWKLPEVREGFRATRTGASLLCGRRFSFAQRCEPMLLWIGGVWGRGVHDARPTKLRSLIREQAQGAGPELLSRRPRPRAAPSMRFLDEQSTSMTSCVTLSVGLARRDGHLEGGLKSNA